MVLEQEMGTSEHEVMYRVAGGKTKGVIADILGITENTVITHLRRRYKKLGVNDRVTAALRTPSVGELTQWRSTDQIPDDKLGHNPSATLITIALVTSTKNADTSGKIMKAVGAGPLALVTAVIFAMAVGVAPNAKPPNPALRTAA